MDGERGGWMDGGMMKEWREGEGEKEGGKEEGMDGDMDGELGGWSDG